MSDEIDRAAAISEVMDAAYLAEARSRWKPEQTQGPDGTWPVTDCVDCGEEIEQPRLLMGRIRCFLCQEGLEKRRKLGL